MTTVEMEVPFIDKDGEVDFLYPYFSARIIIENDGIGSYEYAGIRGYDKGQDYPAIQDDPTWDRENFTDIQNVTISEWYKINYERVEEELYEQFKKDSKD
jgi:hypothetical protein